MSGGYSSEQIDALAGWLSEGLTASQIVSVFCRRFGEDRSRNAIIGIVHRNERLAAIGLGGTGPRSEKGKAAAERHHKAAKRQARPHPGNIRAKRAGRAFDPLGDIVSTAAPEPDVTPKILADLAWNECRWAVNDAAPGEQHLFCAARCGVGPWCTKHALRAGAGYSAREAMSRKAA